MMSAPITAASASSFSKFVAISGDRLFTFRPAPRQTTQTFRRGPLSAFRFAYALP
jgi:hypothetical protein